MNRLEELRKQLNEKVDKIGKTGSLSTPEIVRLALETEEMLTLYSTAK